MITFKFVFRNFDVFVSVYGDTLRKFSHSQS